MNILAKCLCCDGELVPLIDFGPMPLVNTYSVTEKFPLAVNRCTFCCHLQLSEFVDPSILYSDYTYQSGTGRTALDYFASFARTALTYYPEAKNAVDIACNDGSQLDAFKALGLNTYGVDPAENLAAISRSKGHDIRIMFFEDMSFLGGATYDIITAQNVIAHTPRPLEFLEKCTEIMHDKSRLFIATSQANMIVNGECDTVYHEHISYFNAHSMMKLADRAGLVVLDIIMQDIHGTSFVFVLGKSGEPSRNVDSRMDWEFHTGMMFPQLYEWWADYVKIKIKRVKEQIADYQKQGYFAVGVSAAAKGLSMLNMANVKLCLLFDNTPSKIGKTANGMMIIPFDLIKDIERSKVLFVILAHNLSLELKANTLKLRNIDSDVFIELR